MAVAAAGYGSAETASAPAAEATWESDPILCRRDPSAQGQSALAYFLDWFVLHVGQDFTWSVQISDDALTWFTIDGSGSSVTGHADAAAKGTSGSVITPARWARLVVTNDGAAPASTFQAFVAGRVL